MGYYLANSDGSTEFISNAYLKSSLLNQAVDTITEGIAPSQASDPLLMLFLKRIGKRCRHIFIRRLHRINNK